MDCINYLMRFKLKSRLSNYKVAEMLELDYDDVSDFLSGKYKPFVVAKVNKVFGTNFPVLAEGEVCNSFTAPSWIREISMPLRYFIEQEYYVDEEQAVLMASECRTVDDVYRFREKRRIEHHNLMGSSLSPYATLMSLSEIYSNIN